VQQLNLSKTHLDENATQGQAKCLFFFIWTDNNYHVSEYTLAREVDTMLIKLNNKPIDVVEDVEEKSYSPIYWCVSGVGYVLVLWIMDIVCNTFFHSHPFPFLNWLFKLIGGFFNFLGGVL
jgi:hypothetical protein